MGVSRDGTRLILIAFIVSTIISGIPKIAEAQLISTSSKMKFNAAEIYEIILRHPAFWNIEVTGADLAKDDLLPLNLDPVKVVVSDVGVLEGATSVAKPFFLSPQRRMISLSLLAATGVVASSLFSPGLMPARASIFAGMLPNLRGPSGVKYSPVHATHGEHVAGTIGALNQDYGFSSVAAIEDLNVFQGQTPVRASTLKVAYDYLILRPEPTPILNMSHGLTLDKEVETRVQTLVKTRDTLCVLAAGNADGLRIPSNLYLSNLKKCVVVAAFGITGTKVYFSNYGEAVDLVAPGEDILSRGRGLPYKGGNLELMSGTSMAAPAVSGALSILKALLPSARGADLRRILYRTAIDLGMPGKDEFTGYGFLNVVKAESVAMRIHERKINSANEIHAALLAPEVYDFSNEVTALEKERSESSMIDEKKYRRELLLDGSPRALYRLGEYYESKGFKDFGLGLKFAGANRPENILSTDEASSLAREISELQFQRAAVNPNDIALFGSLANATLILKTFEGLDDRDGLSLASDFQRLLYKTDPSAMPELLALIDQKADKTSTIALNDSLKKAP